MIGDHRLNLVLSRRSPNGENPLPGQRVIDLDPGLDGRPMVALDVAFIRALPEHAVTVEYDMLEHQSNRIVSASSTSPCARRRLAICSNNDYNPNIVQVQSSPRCVMIKANHESHE